MPFPMKDIIVVLPGILGSVLRKDDKDVWAPSGGAVWNFLKTRSGSVRALALDDHDDGSLDDLGDGVVATRLMPDVHLIPGLFAIDGYSAIGNYLTTTFDVVAGENYFEFPYDWRRNNEAHGRRLRRESATWLANWREKSGNADAKLVLIAHSMGGLVARSFLELNDGWTDTRRLITCGTPYSGSLNSLDFIANGFKKGKGPVGIDLSALVRSLTSIQQLLPTVECVDVDGALTSVEGSNIPHLDPAHAASAASFHRRINDAAKARRGAGIHPIVGIRQPTLQKAKLSAGALTLSKHLLVAGLPAAGDGTVPDWSATPPEMIDDLKGTVYTAGQHGGLQNSATALEQIEGLLTERPASPFQQADAVKYLAIDLDDFYEVGEDVTIEMGCSDLGASFTVDIANLETGEPAVPGDIVDNLARDELVSHAVGGLDEGSYRVTIGSPADATSVSRVFVIGAGQ